jgi:hypothetical protein
MPSVADHVACVLARRVIAKILEAVVPLVSVPVTAFHALGTRAYKSKKNGEVYAAMLNYAVDARREPQVALTAGGKLQHP